MSKRLNGIDGEQFVQLVVSGAAQLHKRSQQVNALNVFPVPDGDTGTNMNLTMTAGVEELLRRRSDHAGKSAEALAKGLLMGARGNSGVIMSQLFRGFAKSVAPLATIDAQQFAAALQQGVDTAYKAVVKPVEGTILTVAREAAKQAAAEARRTDDVAAVMREALRQGLETLARTPDMLPVLKQVGVVDAGGQGLICVYEGFMAALSGEPVEAADEPHAAANADRPAPPSAAPVPQAQRAQAKLATKDIEHGYCTEFMIKLAPEQKRRSAFDESTFRGVMAKLGDSLLVVADDELVKVHIHAEHPGDVMNAAMRYGELTRIKIENMREQHAHLLSADYSDAAAPAAHAATTPAAASPRKRYAVVAVAAGDGIARIFASLGADAVIAGGQTMNPSTEEIAVAIRQVNADVVFVLPNNSNIVMAARQAQEVVDGKRAIVIPTKTIPQGMAALLAFKEGAEPQANAERMERAAEGVQSGQVTVAVRDTTIGEQTIRANDYIGIHNGDIVAADADMTAACRQLLDRMLADGGDVVTILTGEGASDGTTLELADYVENAYPDAELDVQHGGQPVYAYLFSVE